MTVWLVPGNPQYYDCINAFKDLVRVDWRQRNKYKINDVVFIYTTIPYQKIMIKTIVEEINISYEQMIDDFKYWVKIPTKDELKSFKYVRLRLVDFCNSEKLTLQYLQKYKYLSKAPQSAITINDIFYKFINKEFNNEKNQNKSFVSYEDLIIKYLEEHGKTTVDKLYEYISQIKNTGKTGKRYLREVITNRYKGSDIFKYDNPYVSLKKESQKDTNNQQILEQYEGELKERKYLTRNRNQKIVEQVKQRDNYTCCACGFAYKKKIVQAHHIIPLSEKDEGNVRIDELITLCPTCHLLAHELLKIDKIYQNKNILIKKLNSIRGNANG